MNLDLDPGVYWYYFFTRKPKTVSFISGGQAIVMLARIFTL